AVRFQASARTRTHRSPLWLCDSTTASPSSVARASRMARWGSSAGVSGASGAASAGGASGSTDDNRFPLPALGHVLVLNALLEEHDPFQQGLGPGRAAGHVHVHRDDLVDALRDRVRVPVGAAAV